MVCEIFLNKAVKKNQTQNYQGHNPTQNHYGGWEVKSIPERHTQKTTNLKHILFLKIG